MMTGTLVLLYETGALSAGVITGNYRGIYSTTKDWVYFAVVVTRDDGGFQYDITLGPYQQERLHAMTGTFVIHNNFGALSAAVMTGHYGGL